MLTIPLQLAYQSVFTLQSVYSEKKMSSGLSLTRRVLSDKSTNVSLNIQEHGRDVKGETRMSGIVIGAPGGSPPRTGTKRRFQDIETDLQEESYGQNLWQPEARVRTGPEFVVKAEIEETDEQSLSFMSTTIGSKSTTASSASLNASTSTVLTSFHASQEPSQPAEEQFEIVQEESQRTLEQMVSLPQQATTLYTNPPNSMPHICQNQVPYFSAPRGQCFRTSCHKTVSVCRVSSSSMNQMRFRREKWTKACR